MTRAITILELLASGRDEAVALAAPGRKPLSHAGLRRHVAGTARRLQELGIGRVDRVAMVLGNGPEMAAAFLTG